MTGQFDLQKNDKTSRVLKTLIEIACSSGASEAAIISPGDILVETRLAELCAHPKCENYGLAPGCPPHVKGPSGFRALQNKAEFAIALRIEVSTAVLLSDERREIMRLLHEVAAEVERAAVTAGYAHSQAFVGGSCKKIFCHDLTACPVLAEGKKCYYPKQARPSMSGFGINVSELMKVCGWTAQMNGLGSDKSSDSMSWVAGLVLIG